MKIFLQDEHLYNILKDTNEIEIVRLPNRISTQRFWLDGRYTKAGLKKRKEDWLNYFKNHGYENLTFIKKDKHIDSEYEDWQAETPVYIYNVKEASLEKLAKIVSELDKSDEMYYFHITIFADEDGIYIGYMENES